MAPLFFLKNQSKRVLFSTCKIERPFSHQTVIFELDHTSKTVKNAAPLVLIGELPP